MECAGAEKTKLEQEIQKIELLKEFA